MGNLWSVRSALHYLGRDALVTRDPELVRAADTLILPGVGSFRKAMTTLRASGLDEAILDSVKNREAKILGICLGMQLLGSKGTEDGETTGLGLMPVAIARFGGSELGTNKIPHIGFNSVRFSEREGLFKGLPEEADFYFVHSYRMLPGAFGGRTAICTYGMDFLAGFEIGNVCGVQFHPEKSQTNGLILLKNFFEL